VEPRINSAGFSDPGETFEQRNLDDIPAKENPPPTFCLYFINHVELRRNLYFENR
jgi:hypothetical protein